MVNVNPTNTRAHSETPEIRKYKKRFNSEILCAALWGKPGLGRKRGICVPLCSWSGERLALPLICPRAPIAGVNLLVGTENGLMLLDRSGQGKVYGLIGRRRFQQMDVLEGLNLLITISGVCVEDGGGDRARRRGLSSVALCHHLQPGQRATLVQEPEGGATFSPLVVRRKGWREAGSGSPTKGGCVCVLAPQGKGTNCACITCPGSGTRFCTMTRKWRRSRAGPLWGTWRAAGTTALVRRSQQSGQGTFVYEKK